MRAAVIPDWLTELMRPKPAPLPWPDMIRAALATCVPLAVGFAAGRPSIGLLPAAGGLLGTLTDRGGSYLYRVERVSSVGVFGGAVGLAIGSAIHGRGSIAVIALVVVAGASAVLSSLGDTGSQIGLQLLVYTGRRCCRTGATGTTGCSPRSSPRWWWCWSTCSSPSAGGWPARGSWPVAAGPLQLAGVAPPRFPAWLAGVAWPRSLGRGRFLALSGWPDLNRRPPRPKIVMSLEPGC